MTNLLDDYLVGDCQKVRDVLRESVDASSSPEQLVIATDIADLFVDRCVTNLTRLYDALLAIEYQFADPDNAYSLWPSPQEASVVEFEEEMGKIPLLASRWYRRFESVDFTQSYEQLTDRDSPLAGLGWKVHFIAQSLDKAKEHWEEHCSQCAEDDRSREAAGFPAMGTPTPALLTGGCASNNECMGFDLPSYRFDDVLYNDGGGDRYFGDEVADGFLRGPFPVLYAPERTFKYIRTLYGEPDREFLSSRIPRNFEKV